MFRNTVKESDMVFPREVLIGGGYINRIAELCRKLKVGKRILIVTGKTTKSLVAERSLMILVTRNLIVILWLKKGPQKTA